MWSWLQAIPNIVSKLQTETDDDQRVKKPAAEINQPRILIVDDNPAIHEDFRKTLAPRGSGVDERCDELEALFFDASAAPKIEELALELDVVYQGEDAILAEERAVQEGRPYELAFVDIRMPPGIDGIETATRLWQLDSRLEVVICSAYSDYSWEEMSRRMRSAAPLARRAWARSYRVGIVEIGRPTCGRKTANCRLVFGPRRVLGR
jgi:CheY-like chemotaxis protein